MRYLWILGAILISSYTFMYAVETWYQGNRGGAIGIALVSLIAILFPAALLLLR